MEELTESQGHPYELPDGWVWTKLGDVSNRIKGKKPKVLGPNSDELTVPYVDIEAFEKRVFKSYTDGKDCPLCEPTDILIVWDGARCGLVGSGVEGVIGSTLAKLVHYSLNSAYLFYFLRTQYDLINKNPRGVGIPHIEPIIFWNISFPVPPLNEQDRIVAKLEALLAHVNVAKEHLARVPPLMKQFRQSMLAAACSGRLTKEWRREHPDVEPASELLKRIQEERIKRAKAEGRRKLKKPENLEPAEVDTEGLPELPEGWVWTNIFSITANHDGKRIPVKDKDRQKMQGGYPYYGASGIIDYVNDFLFDGNYLLIGEDGANLVSRSTPIAFKASGKFWVNNHAHVLECEGGIPIEFVEAYINGMDLIPYVTGSAQPKLTQKKLNGLSIPLPPLSEQFVIVERIKKLFQLADIVDQRYHRAQAHVNKLTQSILAKAFSGELVPQDPNDEPASVLLERIKQERAKTEKKVKKARKRTAKTLLDYC